MVLIYHIAIPEEWEQAQHNGDYRISTRGRSLDDQGFIHASEAGQVAPVANAFYADVPRLLVLVIERDRVTSEIRYEAVPGWAEPFPHIYGPLNLDAVVQTLPLEAGPDGHFFFE
jgi:uncharacterized protein (DUF952 family)